ncbi:tryptophan halogenase family protein [uncultured Gilvimarinus sp.]|jgi:tryptophan halogenase|uniref:tryptophan halogenase family protein n=1 Tax=uncultured Gilvimarinus sp. TaxID=1689143 RepID=UPI0030DD2AD2
MANPIKSICIVGGGTTGWMAASLLSTVLQKADIKITVVESPDIATIGVGESTVPSIMDFLRACQINLQEFMVATSASFKLGIRFDDWLTPGKHFFHPFGRVGHEVNGFDFYQAWLKSCADGGATRLADHAPAAIMAESQRFMLRPQQSDSWVLNSYSYALHLDAIAVSCFLRELSQARGVKRIEATVDKALVDERNFITSLELNDGSLIESDFYIDCTGFKGLLIQDALNVGYEDWGEYLPCNRAVTVQTENTASLAPYTVATARDFGWTWKIPLQHRTGNGYVFSSRYCSDEEATDTLLEVVGGKLLGKPRVIPFTTGKRKKLWHNNCLALGLSSGFLEPLESTAIHLVYKSLVHFIKHFPDADFDSCNEQAFNKKIDADYREVRDFIILHYCTAGRADTEFWRWCKNMPVPESLREKIQSFRSRGQVDHSPSQFFSGDSWVSIFEGMNIRPEKYHPLMDAFDSVNISRMLQDNAKNIKDAVESMPMHDDFIRQNCATNFK